MADACCCLQAGDATSSASYKSQRCQDADPIRAPASVQVTVSSHDDPALQQLDTAGQQSDSG